MKVFHIYRLKIDRSEIFSIFEDQSLSSGDIILIAIDEKPSKELRNGQFWRIGNIRKLSKNTVFFALGKITKATHELYDETRGDFVEKPFDEAPNTYVAVDLEYQLCAIVPKTKIATHVNIIAKNLAKLLSASEVATRNHCKVTINEISDPSEFLELVRNAVRISKFEMTFSPPNPFDVDRQFHKPMEDFVQAANAEKGKTTINGDKLEPKIIEDITRSAVSSGSGKTVKACIQSKDDPKPMLKKLDGNPVTVSTDEIDTDDQKRGIFNLMRKAYERVRRSDQSS